MNLQKHEREGLFAVRRICLGISAELNPAGKHPQMIARFAGKQIRVTVSSSPSCAHFVAALTVRLVRRRFYDIGVSLPRREQQ